jgi:hypothetical protein
MEELDIFKVAVSLCSLRTVGFQEHEAEFPLVEIEIQPAIRFPSAKNVTFPAVEVVATIVFAVLNIAVLSPELIAIDIPGVGGEAIEKLLIGRTAFP